MKKNSTKNNYFNKTNTIATVETLAMAINTVP